MRDKEISKIIGKEERRQSDTLDLIPSENIVSEDVLRALGSVFTNKYAEGYPGARYYGGNKFSDELEELTKRRALKLFGLSSKRWSVNVQAHSGSPANLAALWALVSSGEKIMGMELRMGGHLTHGHKASATGKLWRQVHYGVDKKTEKINFAELKKVARREKPRVVIAGFTAYPRRVDFKKFREVADATGAYLLVDASHIAGLIAGKSHPSPFKYADVVVMTTHKTLRGPRGALIFSRAELAPLIDRAVFPGLQGGPHLNQMAGIAVALKEAARSDFKKYARKVVENARVLAETLEDLGWRVVSGGTDTHLLLVDTWKKGIGGREASEKLEKNGIIVNKNTLPFDARSPVDPSGIRLGTPSLTTRGMGASEMRQVARLISMVLLANKDAHKEVGKLCRKFPAKKK